MTDTGNKPPLVRSVPLHLQPAPSPVLDVSVEPILSVRDLAVTLQPSGSEIVSRIAFDIPRGAAVGLIGESGSGKSSICLAILRLLNRSVATSGIVRFDGRDLLQLSGRDLNRVRRSQIGFVAQDPVSHFNPVRTIGSQFRDCFRGNRVAGAMAAQRMIELLSEVGTRDPERILSAYPHQVSGGQAQRVMLAMALAGSPDLLIADEPSTALDMRVQVKVLTLLKAVQRSRGLSVLMVSHDLHAVADLCDHIIVLKDGLIVEQGRTQDVLTKPGQTYTQILLRAFFELPSATRQFAHLDRPGMGLSREARPGARKMVRG